VSCTSTGLTALESIGHPPARVRHRGEKRRAPWSGQRNKKNGARERVDLTLCSNVGSPSSPPILAAAPILHQPGAYTLRSYAGILRSYRRSCCPREPDYGEIGRICEQEEHTRSQKSSGSAPGWSILARLRNSSNSQPNGSQAGQNGLQAQGRPAACECQTRIWKAPRAFSQRCLPLFERGFGCGPPSVSGTGASGPVERCTPGGTTEEG